MSGFDAEVIVVGAGPSGLMVAAELALAGVPVLVLERRGEPALPRAGTLQPRVLEIFDTRGIVDRFVDRARELHTKPEAPQAIWAGLPGIRYDRLDSPFPHILLLAQKETEQILFDRVVELGGRVLRHHDVKGLRQTDDHVEVDVDDGSGQLRAMRAQFVVGADGARSTVREAAGIRFIGTEATRTAINVDARLDNPWAAPITVTNNENGWGLSYPLEDGVTRFGLIDAIASLEPRDAPVTLDAARNMLTRIFGTDFGIKEIVWLTRFHNALFLADKFRAGRVFIVGESVRVHYPASGVGMNFCLMDAFNLAWKLVAAVQGWAPEGLLDSYEAERRPTIEALLNDVRRQCAIQFNYSEDMVALKRLIEHELIPLEPVNNVLRLSTSGLDARYAGPEEPVSLVGKRVRDMTLTDATSGTPTTLHALLHDQTFAWIDLTGGTLPSPSLPAERLRKIAVRPQNLHADVAGLAALFVRPDGHLAWAATRQHPTGMPADAMARWHRATKPVPAHA